MPEHLGRPYGFTDLKRHLSSSSNFVAVYSPISHHLVVLIIISSPIPNFTAIRSLQLPRERTRMGDVGNKGKSKIVFKKL